MNAAFACATIIAALAIPALGWAAARLKLVVERERADRRRRG